MPSELTPQQRGRAFEADFARKWGASQVPASGAGPRYKLDVGTVEVIASLKFTAADSIRLEGKDVRELLEHAGGPGSRDQLGILALRIEGLGVDLFVATDDAMAALLQGDVELKAPPSTTKSKRALATPALLREGESA